MVPVILFHAGLSLFSGGYVGVDVFFVISGYLITTILAEDVANQRFSLIGFYERRARRILPALFVVIVCCIPFAWTWLLPDDLQSFSQSIISVILFISNFFFWQSSDYFNPNTELQPLLHTWSLAVEEQFYVVFPLLLAGLWPLGITRLLGCLALLFAASLLISVWSAEHAPEAGFYLFASRSWELLTGAFIALYLHKRPDTILSKPLSNALSCLGLALLLFAVLAFDCQTPFPGYMAAVPVLGTALIILFARPFTWVGKILGTKPFVAIGLVSYSAYLWHQPLFAFARYRNVTEPGILLMIGLIFVTFILAWISWAYVEAPFRDRERITRRALWTGGLLSASVLCLMALGGHITKGAPARFAPQIQTVLQASQRSKDEHPCVVTQRHPPTDVLKCTQADLQTIYLIGDSHAASIASPLRDALRAEGFQLVRWTQISCYPVPGTARLPRTANTSCWEYKHAVEDFLVENPAPVILAARWRFNLTGHRFDNGQGGLEHGDSTNTIVAAPTYGATLAEATTGYVSALAQHMPVIVLDQVPEAGWDVPAMVARNLQRHDSPEPLTTSYAVYLEENAPVRAMMDQMPEGVYVVSPSELVCSAQTGRCLNEIDHVPLYRDDDHPSSLFGQMIAAQIVQRIRSVLLLSD